MARFFLHTLTPQPRLVETTPAGDRERLRCSKQLAVLVYLAARSSGVGTREELVHLLWGDSDLRDARHALRQAIHQIRRHMGPDVLSGETVLSVSRCDLDWDVALFREHVSTGRLEQALALYQGGFLATVRFAEAKEFEDWAEGLRRQLAAERRHLVGTLISQSANQAQWCDAVHYTRILIEDDPANLEPRLRLVELTALSGNLVEARAEADEVRRLAAEAREQPLPRTIEAAIARALAAGPAERRPLARLPRLPEMVGRATEFRRVVERWKRTLEGRGHCVLISGEPGIGKTRLVREIERRLRQDPSLVLTAACYPVEGAQPFASFLEMIAEAHAAPGLGGASPGSLAILAALIPDIAYRFRNAVSPRRPPIPDEAVAGALLDAFTAIAEEVPLALLLDDLHWASAVTIAFAHKLARRAKGSRLLMVLSGHDAARTGEKTLLLRDLARSRAVDAILLQPLDASDLAHLLGTIARLPSEPAGAVLAARLTRYTGGVPRYALELLEGLHDGGQLAVEGGAWVIPDSTVDDPVPLSFARSSLLRRRLDALDPGAEALLAALAVWGRDATVHDLAQIAAVPEPAVREGLGALAQRRFLAEPAEQSFAVAHQEIGDAVLAAVSPVLLAMLNRNAATLAEFRARVGSPQEWLVAGRHAAAAGDPARAALDALRGAAEIELRSGAEAAREELRWWLRALPDSVRPEIEARLRPLVEGMPLPVAAVERPAS